MLKVDKHIELLGYTSKDSIDIDSICRYHEKVHSDDLPYLYDSEIKMYHFLNSIGGIEKKDFKAKRYIVTPYVNINGDAEYNTREDTTWKAKLHLFMISIRV